MSVILYKKNEAGEIEQALFPPDRFKANLQNEWVLDPAELVESVETEDLEQPVEDLRVTAKNLGIDGRIKDPEVLKKLIAEKQSFM